MNLTAKIGLTNQLIPATAQRAYSCLSVPLSNAAQIDLAADSLGGIIDHCQNYQYVHGNKLIPDRPVPLERYNNAPPHVDALHLIELEKALLNCGFPTRNLQRPTKHERKPCVCLCVVCVCVCESVRCVAQKSAP